MPDATDDEFEAAVRDKPQLFGLSHMTITSVQYPPEPPEGTELVGYLVEEIRCSYPKSREAADLAGAVAEWIKLGTDRSEIRAIAMPEDDDGTRVEHTATWKAGEGHWGAWV